MTMFRPSRLATALVAIAAGAAMAQAASSGHVRKVDAATGRLTLEHAGVTSLDMPPMTTVFQVKDKQALSTLKPGDRVQFTAAKVDGTYTVTTLKKP